MRSEAHPVPAFAPQARHRPGNEQPKDEGTDNRFPGIGPAIAKAGIITAAPYPVPVRAAQPITKAPEYGEPGHVEEDKIEGKEEHSGKGRVPAQDQRLRHELEQEERHEEDRNHQQEAQEQFLACARPFKPVVNEPCLAPEVAPFACNAPEAVKTQSHDREHEVREQDRRQLPPVTIKGKCRFVLRSNPHTGPLFLSAERLSALARKVNAGQCNSLNVWFPEYQCT